MLAGSIASSEQMPVSDTGMMWCTCSMSGSPQDSQRKSRASSTSATTEM